MSKLEEDHTDWAGSKQPARPAGVPLRLMRRSATQGAARRNAYEELLAELRRGLEDDASPARLEAPRPSAGRPASGETNLVPVADHRDPRRTPSASSGLTGPSRSAESEPTRRMPAADPGLTRPGRSAGSGRTQPTPSGPGGNTPPGGIGRPPGRRPVWWRWLLGIPLYGLLVLGVAGLAGYRSGLEQREQAEVALANQALQEQFDLGVQDLLAQRYELARQRFDYILSVDPHYPGVLELLEQARQALNQPTLTPSPLPSPTIIASPTATLDFGNLDGLFAAAQAAQLQGDWDGVINALLALRDQSPDHRRQEANQMLYAALRSRGLQKIWNGEQEQGIYDLSLARRLGPLDGQAQSWLNSAAFYLFADSYYGLDWPLAAQHFGQICGAGIWDACFKFARSAWEYGDLLFKNDDDPCAAVDQYETSLDTYSDSSRAPTATEMAEVCMTATAPRPTDTPTVTVDLTLFFTETPTLPGPTESLTPTLSGPTFTPTFTLTSGPTATPTPTPTATSTFTPTPTETPIP